MPDYSKGKIYKMLHTIDDEIYVGSTIDTLGQRMAKHRSDLKIRPNYKIYKHMNELGVGNFYIELIENYYCNDVYELRAREGHFIREIGTLNMLISGRSDKEYYKDNQEHIKQSKKQYYEDNKNDKIKQYREDNKEHIKEYSKQYINQYRKNNAELFFTKEETIL